MAARRKIKPAKSAAVKLVMGVRMDKVDEDLVRLAYASAVESSKQMADSPMELEDSDDDLESLVSNLVLWYRAASAPEDLCDCSTCGGDSDARLDRCPFCGDAEEASDEPAHEAEVVATPAPSQPKSK